MKKLIFLASAILLVSQSIMAQDSAYPCQKEGSPFLANLTGTWQVKAKDRTSPGNYETNEGQSTIAFQINGCTIRELYEGKYKNADYAVDISYILTDSLQVSKVWVDSNHANPMVLSGQISDNQLYVEWYRNPEKKRMQVRHFLTAAGSGQLNFRSELSTDYGETWQMTHEWEYTRIE